MPDPAALGDRYDTMSRVHTVPILGDEMPTDTDTISAAAGMTRKAAVPAARWARTRRRRALEKIAALTVGAKDKEISCCARG